MQGVVQWARVQTTPSCRKEVHKLGFCLSLEISLFELSRNICIGLGAQFFVIRLWLKTTQSCDNEGWHAGPGVSGSGV
jgi:hypothetical protein